MIDALSAIAFAIVIKQSSPKPACSDKLVNTVVSAGFRGEDVRIAYAVAMRESNGHASEGTYPDLGLFQLNYPAWSGSEYWPSDPLDGKQNARSAFRMVRDMGWQPWGLTDDGDAVDASSYGSWSQWQIDNWVWIPYAKYRSQFPNKCKSYLR